MGMRIYIMTDQEGVAGVLDSGNFCAPDRRYYETARELLTLEVNAAIEGAIEAGATEFFVVDGHGGGSINPQLLHRRARLFAGRPMGYPFMCDSGFAAAFSVGQHAKANTRGAHLCHTGSFSQEELLINGLSVGEMGINFLFTGYFGVPNVLLTGDKAACEEARALVPNIVTAAVKEGFQQRSSVGLTAGQNQVFNGAAVHLHPEMAQELIRRAAKEAVGRVEQVGPFVLDPPYELVSVLRPESPGGERKVAVCRADDLLELLTMPRIHEVDTHAARYLQQV